MQMQEKRQNVGKKTGLVCFSRLRTGFFSFRNTLLSDILRS